MKKGIVITLIVFALVGLIDASYLTSEHYNGGGVVCEIGGHTLGDCGTVTSSKYSTVGPVPLALLGALYYFAVLVLVSFLLTTRSRKILKAITFITGVGFVASLYFVYLQLFVLDAICVYCMVSALTTTILFATGLLQLRSKT